MSEEELMQSPLTVIREETNWGVVNVAVQGCCHGELDTIYAKVCEAESSTGTKVDLLLICGDFECVRDTVDLCCMAVPPKYRHLKNFYKYFNGECTAPVKTVFIGGNHEASNVLQSLYYGGYVAPNIYFLGWAAIVNFKGLRIGGMSGIYNDKHYTHGHFERPPYSDNTMRSIYHVRAFEVQQMLHFPTPSSPIQTSNRNIDIFLTHDWPVRVWEHGDIDTLLRIKPYFRSDIEKGVLGSAPARQLMDHLQPPFWFAGHMHYKFAAVVPHAVQSSHETAEGTSVNNLVTTESRCTRFLALDKVIPGREYLQFLQIPVSSCFAESIEHIPVYDDDDLHFDVEWCTIMRLTHHDLGKTRYLYSQAPSQVCIEDILETKQLLQQEYGDLLVIPMQPLVAQSSFPHQAEGGDSVQDVCAVCEPPIASSMHFAQRLQEGNPQTDRFLRSLRLPHVWTIPFGSVANNGKMVPPNVAPSTIEPAMRTTASATPRNLVPTQVQLSYRHSLPLPHHPPSILSRTCQSATNTEPSGDPNELDI